MCRGRKVAPVLKGHRSVCLAQGKQVLGEVVAHDLRGPLSPEIPRRTLPSVLGGDGTHTSPCTHWARVTGSQLWTLSSLCQHPWPS